MYDLSREIDARWLLMICPVDLKSGSHGNGVASVQNTVFTRDVESSFSVGLLKPGLHGSCDSESIPLDFTGKASLVMQFFICLATRFLTL